MPGPSPTPATQTANAGDYRLTIAVPRLTYHPGEAIDVTANLTYLGSRPKVVVVPTDVGLLNILFKQLDGPLSMGPFSRLMCARETITLQRGVPTTFPAVKNAGYEPDKSTTAFYLAWNADPLVHLPVGRWQVAAHVGSCGLAGGPDSPDIDLTTPPLILVVAP